MPYCPTPRLVHLSKKATLRFKSQHKRRQPKQRQQERPRSYEMTITVAPREMIGTASKINLIFTKIIKIITITSDVMHHQVPIRLGSKADSLSSIESGSLG